MSAPPAHTALAALPVAVLDLETTGLDVARDRIVQVGAVAMLGATVLDAPRLDRRVDPGVPIPATATRIHGLGDADVAGEARFTDVVEALRTVLDGRAVVGHHVAFDLAVLRHEAARAGVAWRDPPALDVAHLAGALEPALPDLGLEALAGLLGVALERRHDALGDALSAAAILAALLPRLREAEVRTFGEARALAARRDDLARREVQAGWHAAPGEAPVAPPPAPFARVDGHLYARRVRDVMRAPPVIVAPATTLRAAAREMSARRIGALLVAEGTGPAAGIVTERDVLRAAADAGVDLDATPVSAAMSAPVASLPGAEMLYRALARMDRLGVRHLAVVDAAGATVGMISQRDLLRHRARAAAELGDAVEHAGDAAALAAAHGRVADVAAGLVGEGLSGVEVARVVSNELRAVTARAAEIAVERLAAGGRGPAPAPWCLLVLGSGGRGESLLAADQDNAVVHAGADADDAWFAALGACIADLLDEAGVARCRGGVMAANPQWRGTRDGWRGRVDGWLRRARPGDLLDVDIFFDLQPVAGDAGLGRALHADAVAAASRAPTFLALLAESTGSKPPAIGAFGRLRTVDGRVDLKLGGLLPLTGLARTLALRIGSSARATPERLADARAAGRLAAADAAALTEAHEAIVGLVLAQQLADLEAGVRPSGRVAVERLDRGARRRLVRCLRRLDEALRTLRSAIA